MSAWILSAGSSIYFLSGSVDGGEGMERQVHSCSIQVRVNPGTLVHTIVFRNQMVLAGVLWCFTGNACLLLGTLWNMTLYPRAKLGSPLAACNCHILCISNATYITAFQVLTGPETLCWPISRLFFLWLHPSWSSAPSLFSSQCSCLYSRSLSSGIFRQIS